MKLEIVRRQFTKVDETWCEVEDLRNRGLAVDRSWSSFCVLIPGEDLDALTASLRSQFSAQRIDVVPSTTGKGRIISLRLLWRVSSFCFQHSWLAEMLAADGTVGGYGEGVI